MASVAPPQPSYRPHLPPRLVSDGILSEAQLESVIYAGEAHGGHLAGAWTVDATFDTIAAAADDAEGAVRFRRGWFLGDGTGAGKGRQVAGIILDNWMQGRRRAVWISKSDKLIEDAQRDWSALGQERLQITPLARFRQGNAIRLDEGILFTTYATIRTQEREGKASRVQQIVDWLGADFDGVIVFDEAHAMANAAGGKGEPRRRRPLAAGPRRPAPAARFAPRPHPLRLGHRRDRGREPRLCAAPRPVGRRGFSVRHPRRIHRGDGGRRRRRDGGAGPRSEGARPLRRPLAVLRRHRVRARRAPADRRADRASTTPMPALSASSTTISTRRSKAADITGADGERYNAQAKAAARSAFESSKQRFFIHLLTAMKCPTLIARPSTGISRTAMPPSCRSSRPTRR